MNLAALSVDLDEIPCYYAIHGLGEVPADVRSAVYRRAVPRFRELLAELDVPCTFFAIGHDLDDAAALEQVRLLARAGHELANHSLSHRYDLVRLGATAIRAEVRGGVEAIARATGRAPVGFRAPGYTTSDEVLAVLADEGVAYDSSVFPCPAYWAAKAAAIGLIAARGRRSRSVVDTPRVLHAPAEPYFPGRPYWQRSALDHNALVELPIGVTRGLRLPYIGTSVMLAGPGSAGLLATMMAGRALVNLELHGLDLLDTHDGLDALARHQRDLRVPVARKLATLRATVTALRSRGYRFVTLEQAARAFREGPS